MSLSKSARSVWWIMKEFLIAASRGRNPKNPSDRTTGIYTEQRLEINKQCLCNTLTTVLKDNYVIEIEEYLENETGTYTDIRNQSQKERYQKD